MLKDELLQIGRVHLRGTMAHPASCAESSGRLRSCPSPWRSPFAGL